MRYYKRIIENTIECKLNDECIVNIVGPMECGKSSVASKFAGSVISLNSGLDSFERLCEFRPDLLFDGDKPLLIEDIESLPYIKDAVDTSSRKINDAGVFITTNSRTMEDSIWMGPLTLYESGDSTGKVKILDLFNNPDLNIDGVTSMLDFEDLIDVTIKGGFPRVLSGECEINEYIDRVVCKYVPEICGSKRDCIKLKTILEVYSENIYTFTKNTEILKEIESRIPNFAKSTYYTYVNDLKEVHIIDEIPAWQHKIKSPTAIKSSSKRSFCDPSIPAALLNLSGEDLFFNLDKLDNLFKNLCYRDLKVYSSPLGGKISYYADRYSCEVDCILEIGNGDYALINFHLNSQDINECVHDLVKFADFIKKRIDRGVLKIKKPKFLAIITASKFAFTHCAGVKIIPIGVLG